MSLTLRLGMDKCLIYLYKKEAIGGRVKKYPLTLAVITLNEEANIERCLRSVDFVDDIVVVDSGSTDRTVEIAEQCGARVFVEKWRGYRAQKARATELAKNHWVLSLDADEALSEELSQEIQKLFLKEKPPCSAYRIPRISYHLGRWIRHGGWYPDYQLRLFDKSRSRWAEGHVHERIETEKLGTLTNDMKHWVFKDLSDNVDTNNEYSSLGAKDLEERGKRFSLFKLIFKPWGKFLETYIVKRGFLDGLPGFIIAVGASYSMFLKFAKLWERKSK